MFGFDADADRDHSEFDRIIDRGATSSCVITAPETEGPYPDRMGMLNNPAFNRRDVTAGKPGTPLALTLTIVSLNGNCSPIQRRRGGDLAA